MSMLLDMEGEIFMVIDIDKDSKLAFIWLTNEEQLNTSITNEVEVLIKDFSKQKYKVAIFKSGKEDVVELTCSLLAHNKNI